MGGHEDPVSLAQYPLYNEDLIDNGAELSEEAVKSTLNDIEEIIRVTKMTPQKVYLYTAPCLESRSHKVCLRTSGRSSA